MKVICKLRGSQNQEMNSTPLQNTVKMILNTYFVQSGNLSVNTLEAVCSFLY